MTRNTGGKNFGKWMLAATYKRLSEKYRFEEIITCMVPVNKYIITLNEAIGYKKVKGSSWQEYIFYQDDLVNIIKTMTGYF